MTTIQERTRKNRNKGYIASNLRFGGTAFFVRPKDAQRAHAHAGTINSKRTQINCLADSFRHKRTMDINANGNIEYPITHTAWKNELQARNKHEKRTKHDGER